MLRTAKATPTHIVINLEEQYSIWPDEVPLPMGWEFIKTHFESKSECLRYIKEHWLDMRPSSLIEK
ncbi:MAG: MbtH family NRPS accessory protein [Legionella sp.]|jgi:MbtH protein